MSRRRVAVAIIHMHIAFVTILLALLVEYPHLMVVVLVDLLRSHPESLVVGAIFITLLFFTKA
jgi:hypothetical protein